MVAITPAVLTGLSILGMVQNAIALSGATEADSLAVVRGISESFPEEVYHDKRATGKLPKPVRKVAQAAVKVGSSLPGKKYLKAAAVGAEKKAVKASISASKTKNKVKSKFGGKRDLAELEVFYDTRATGKLPKPVRKIAQAAIKVGSKLPGKKYLKAAAVGAEKKAVKASISASSTKNKIKSKFGGKSGKRDLESGEFEILVDRDVLADLIARSVADNWDAEVHYGTRATGKLPKPVRKIAQAAVKVGSKLPGKKYLKAAAVGAEKKAVKASISASKTKNKVKSKFGGKRDLGEDYDFEVRDFDDEIYWE